MEIYVASFVFAVSLGFAFAAPSPIKINEDLALQECKAKSPYSDVRNPRDVAARGIATGNRIKLTPQEKCVLLCFLQKVNFLDENANIRSVDGLVNHTLAILPELAKYSDVLYAQIFQTSRSMKEFHDKCQQAFVTYHQYAQTVFTLGMADNLESITNVRNKVIRSVRNGRLVDQKVSNKVIEFLTFFDALEKKLVEE